MAPSARWRGKADRLRIALTREPIDCRTTGKRQAQEPRGFIECLARRIVASSRDDTQRVWCVDVDELRMAARHEQREKGVFRLDLRLEKGREDVAVQMIDRVQRLARRERERLGRGDA